MVRFAVIAMMAAVSAAGAAQALFSLERHGEPPRAAVALAEPASPESGASISKGADGHYWAQADVDGHAVKFLVDTGATAVALTTDDARRLGFDPNSLDYAYKVETAAGDARAARISLPSVAIGPTHVADVEAYVLDRGLPVSLLGMTYLGRLSSFEATPTALILRP